MKRLFFLLNDHSIKSHFSLKCNGLWKSDDSPLKIQTPVLAEFRIAVGPENPEESGC
ncbi:MULTISPECIES: hypothetical protein [unclassified Mesorhizobium]|uniref:hypothetical protein n=1 Tax=unclassified Mesorhizobium TaxID=325217 RepID=UPI0015E278DF|nr:MULTISPECIES: hypothetical protein [unclassified Mesorhizobium]MBZ9997255.1 hypothetical protein [Mesorhizobium sp. BH1-1-4]